MELSGDATFAFSADDAGARFACSLDGGTWTACTSPATVGNLGIGQQTEGRYVAPRMPIYDMAGVDPGDIQILGALDAFSPVVLFILEEYGFCGEGEALAFVQDGRTAPGGTLAVNTCGGGLSDMESYGWGHEIDMVKQMRGQAGAGQLPDVRVCQYASLDHSSLILTRQ